MLGKIDHVSIVVKDIEKAIAFYSEVLGWKLPREGPYSRILSLEVPGEKIRYAMLSAGQNYFELVEPKEGIWLEILKERGEGAICELCVLVDDIEEARLSIEKKGMVAMDWSRKPLKEPYMTSPSGTKIFYMPTEGTFGTWIEVLERPKRKQTGKGKK